MSKPSVNSNIKVAIESRCNNFSDNALTSAYLAKLWTYMLSAFFFYISGIYSQSVKLPMANSL